MRSNKGKRGGEASVAHRLGEVVQVHGGEPEEVVAAEPADRRHASFSARGGGGRRAASGAGAAGWGRRSIRIRVSSFSRRNAACRWGFLEAPVVRGEDGQAHVEKLPGRPA